MEMNDNIYKLLMIDQDIEDFIQENKELTDLEFEEKFEETNYITKAINILKRMNSKDILELIKRCRCLWNFIDLKKFIKKYPLNKTFLKNNKDLYLDEYYKLQNTCFYLRNISYDIKELDDYYNLLNVYDVEKYLLLNMPNEQIYKLACSSNNWEEKLYFFSFFKKNK